MPKNSDYKNMSYVGEFAYLDLEKPKKWNNAQEEFESFEPESGIGAYSISWLLSAEDGEAFDQTCREHFKERKKDNQKIKSDYGATHCLKQNEDGTYLVTAKLNASGANGVRQPKVVDKAMQPIADKNFWGGTKGAVKYSIAPQPNPSTNKWGISAYIQAVQITEPKRGEDDGIFVNEPSESQKSLDDVGLITDAIETQPKHASADLDDEIPF